MPVPFISEASIAALDAAIARYQQIAAAGGWPMVRDNATLRLGDTSADISTIRKHLMIEGDLPQGNASNPNFDAQFQEGLARFQIRNGQRVSGFVDSRTLAALNVPASERVTQLQTNLVRVKELMKINQAPRYVLVNVPAFTAQAVEKGDLALDSNVVAGKPARATPEVSARIVEVNFFPTWSVPETVAQQDLIPKIRKDPSYFANEHFSVMTDWKAKPLDLQWERPKW
jgi:murein L,D-transpeptidase YcbB/YkuD